MNTTFKVSFNVTNLGFYGLIPGFKKVMQSELVRVYNLYADKTNSGITDMLYELTKYNKFMADGYQRLIVNDFNKKNVSPILDFFVDPEEVVLKGYLKWNHDVTIDFI